MVNRRDKTGEWQTRTYLRGRKSALSQEQKQSIIQLVQEQPDITINEIIDRLHLTVSDEKQMAGGVFGIIGVLVSVATLFLEVDLTNRYSLARATDCYLMLLPCTFFLFPKILDWKIELKQAKWLRVASTIIFFSQFLLLFASEIAEWMLKVTIPCLAKFSFATLCGLAITGMAILMSNRTGLRWLKYFY